MIQVFDHLFLPLQAFTKSIENAIQVIKCQIKGSGQKCNTHAHHLYMYKWLQIISTASCVVLFVVETHIVKEGHSVTTVNGKHQGKKAEEAGLEGCHAVLEVQMQYVSCQIQQMRVRIPCCGRGRGCDEEELRQAQSTANW